MKYFIILTIFFTFIFAAIGKELSLFEQAVESGRRAEAEAAEAQRLGLKVVKRETPRDQLVDLTKFFPGFERANELIDEGAERFEDDF